MQDLIHRPDIHVTTIETQTDISLDCSYNSLRSITTYAQDGSNSRRFEYAFEDSTRYNIINLNTIHRIRRCGLCREIGHNRSRCPNRS